MYSTMAIVNTAVIYRNVVRRADPKNSHHEEKTIFFIFFLVSIMRCWMLAKLTEVISS